MKKNKHAKKIELKSVKDFPPVAMSLGPMSFNRTGTWRNIRPVFDRTNCIQCGICWKFCPDVAITIENEFPAIDYYYCKGCGICAEECPKDCIIMKEEEK